jgi:hypothetical protein
MLETARQQWDEGLRRLDTVGAETARGRHLWLLVEAVLAELRRRVGQTFTLTELARAYDGAEDWVRDVVREAAPPQARAGIRTSRSSRTPPSPITRAGASDYRP